MIASFLFMFLISAETQPHYYLIKNQFIKGVTCSEQAQTWLDINATYHEEVNGDAKRQGYYMKRSGKKELVFGHYCGKKIK